MGGVISHHLYSCENANSTMNVFIYKKCCETLRNTKKTAVDNYNYAENSQVLCCMRDFSQCPCSPVYCDKYFLLHIKLKVGLNYLNKDNKEF